MTDLLILGGTTEARQFADLVVRMEVTAIVSLAGVTAVPADMALPTRTGGFGGPEGLIAWMRENTVKSVVDATHPFAERMPWNVAQACEELGIPRLRLVRPGFRKDPDWRQAVNLEDAIAPLPTENRVLLTTGRSDLEVLSLRPDLKAFVRTIEPIGDLPENAEAFLIQPPLDLTEELAFLRTQRVQTVIAKDSGGPTRTKLEAAKLVGAEVILIKRPEQPPGPTVETVDQAVAWLRQVVGIGK
ncbi:MAG: cobalt-precorrin-6A reductase [Pseudomonadota bacterium]